MKQERLFCYFQCYNVVISCFNLPSLQSCLQRHFTLYISISITAFCAIFRGQGGVLTTVPSPCPEVVGRQAFFLFQCRFFDLCWAAFLSMSLLASIYPVFLPLHFLFVRSCQLYARMPELGRASVHELPACIHGLSQRMVVVVFLHETTFLSDLTFVLVMSP